MKIKDIASSLNLDIICRGNGDKQVESAITGDLMSFIVGKATSGSIWITVQNHLNVAAVAVLKEIPLIIITSGRAVPSDLKERCEIEGITLASSDESTFKLCSKLSELGING